MHEGIRLRVYRTAASCVETRATVRELARASGSSKSTVHKDLTERLMALDDTLAAQVAQVLAEHRETRHLRGGAATRALYTGVPKQDWGRTDGLPT